MVDYRDVLLNYHLDIDVRVFDRHFSEIFDYAKIEGEEPPVIEEKDVPELGQSDELGVVEAAQAEVIPEADKGSE